jgi:hypothetical protein
LGAHSQTFIFSIFVVDILWLSVDEMLQVVNFVFALLDFLFRCRVRSELVVYLVLFLGHVDFVVWCCQSWSHFLLYLCQFFLLLGQCRFLLAQLVLKLLHFLELVCNFIPHLFNVALQVLHFFSCTHFSVLQGPQIIESDLVLSLGLGSCVLTSIASCHWHVFSRWKLIRNLKHLGSLLEDIIDIFLYPVQLLQLLN